MNITLPEIEAAHIQLGEMIAAFKKKAPTTYKLPAVALELHHGEHYAGLVLHDDGTPSHHLILIEGEATGVNWEEAKAWAAKQGGELPTPQEQALLYANLKSHFNKAWYWSGTQYSDGYAYGQTFGNGYQYYHAESWSGGSAGAVRRFAA